MPSLMVTGSMAFAVQLIEHKQYINKHGQALPSIRDWKRQT